MNILVLFHANNVLDPEWIAVLWWHHQHATPSWSENKMFLPKTKTLDMFLKTKLQSFIAFVRLFVSDLTVRNLPL